MGFGFFIMKLVGILKKWTGAETDQEALKKLQPRLEAKVLVFDDLERSAMPLVDALGLINGFVEHGDHKVIVIANQKEVPSEQREQYEKQRETVSLALGQKLGAGLVVHLGRPPLRDLGSQCSPCA